MRLLLLLIALIFAACAVGDEPRVAADEQLLLRTSPANATPAPGDYDGDGCTDISVKSSSGIWYIDYCRNGFGGRWDAAFTGYGAGIPVPADYDGDGVTDLAVKDSTGMWGIDYAWNGFGVFDLQVFGYGDSTAIPVPARYDDDLKADLSVKTHGGQWYIDYSSNGFGAWDVVFNGYGDSLAVPVPADYDGDLHADLSVKASNGCWHIDYWKTGFGVWDKIVCGYGNASAVPVPADYDNDGKADLAVKDSSGSWLVDYAADGFGAWNAEYSNRGGSSYTAVPGYYDFDTTLDLAAKNNANGLWYIDFGWAGFTGWTVFFPTVRAGADTTRPYIGSTTVYGPGNTMPSQLMIGVRYTVDVLVYPGSSTTQNERKTSVEINPDLNVDPSLKIDNREGSSFVPVPGVMHRRFALTCTRPGNFALGFQLRTEDAAYGAAPPFNQDYGTRVICAAAQTGLYGTVTRRKRDGAGVYVAGAPIPNALVEVPGFPTQTTGPDGRWSLPAATGGPHRITVSAIGFSLAIALAVNVPEGSGFQLDTSLEEAFTELRNVGAFYTTYVDYSRGRTILHTVTVNTTSGSTVKIKPSVQQGIAPVKRNSSLEALCGRGAWFPLFDTLLNMSNRFNSLVMMNGSWWDLCTDRAIGYVYSLGPAPTVHCGSLADCPGLELYYKSESGAPMIPEASEPMLTIVGTRSHQQFAIVYAHRIFTSGTNGWAMVGDPQRPIWDQAAPHGVSDVEYAMQISNPPLLVDCDSAATCKVIGTGPGYTSFTTWNAYENSFARTSVGVGPNGVLFLVVADGEGVQGGAGATPNQLGRFYKDVLGATAAMGLDSGLSTELVLKGVSGQRVINTMTGEDAGIQENPYTEVLPHAIGGVGAVANYIMVTTP